MIYSLHLHLLAFEFIEVRGLFDHFFGFTIALLSLVIYIHARLTHFVIENIFVVALCICDHGTTRLNFLFNLSHVILCLCLNVSSIHLFMTQIDVSLIIDVLHLLFEISLDVLILLKLDHLFAL